MISPPFIRDAHLAWGALALPVHERSEGAVEVVNFSEEEGKGQAVFAFSKGAPGVGIYHHFGLNRD